jgi:hypothetical protein
VTLCVTSWIICFLRLSRCFASFVDKRSFLQIQNRQSKIDRTWCSGAGIIGTCVWGQVPQEQFVRFLASGRRSKNAAVPVAFAQSGRLVPASECRGIPFSANCGELSRQSSGRPSKSDHGRRLQSRKFRSGCLRRYAGLLPSLPMPHCYQILGESERAFKRPCGICLQTCGTLRKAVALCRPRNAVVFTFRQTAESFRDSLQADRLSPTWAAAPGVADSRSRRLLSG